MILRVFPHRTCATPADPQAFVGDPPLFLPPAADVDAVHVSVTFTWDLAEGQRLQRAWAQYYGHVQLGGPAVRAPVGDFEPGLYLAPGHVITSYGCPNACRHCLVAEREGPLRLVPVREGWNVCDNNLLACPREHVEAVLDMLDRQPRPARFTGGLEAACVRPWLVERLARLRIDTIYTAYDRPEQWPAVASAVGRIQDAFGWSAGTSRRRLACYVLVGQDGDTPAAAAERLHRVGALDVAPFPMFYRPPLRTRRPMPPEWHDLVGRALRQPWASRMWSRRMAIERSN